MSHSGRTRRNFIGIAGLGAAAAAPWEHLALAAKPKAAPSPGSPGLFDVTQFGAVGDGRTLCTEGLQKAIDACGAAGGGTVVLPPGRYLTGGLNLRSHVHLHVAPGATLLASQRPDDFPPIAGREEGIERKVHSSLINGADLENVSVSGGGLLDGQGAPWWAAYEATRNMRLAAKLPREAEDPPAAPLKYPRPRMVNLIRCRGAVVEGLTFKDSPGANVHLLYCENVIVTRITSSQTQWARGTEAVIVDSSKRVRISDSRMSSGADCIGIKSGYNEDGRRVGRPSEDILISHCLLFKMSCGSVIGSEIAGNVRNVVVSDCVIRDSLSAMRVRAPRGRGGVVENVRVSNLVVDHCDEMAIKLSNYFDSARSEGRFISTEPGRQNLEMARSVKVPVDVGTPTFRDISFSGLTITRAREVAVVEGLPERFIRGVVFEDVSATRVQGGIGFLMSSDVTVSNFTADTLEAPAVDAREVQRLEVHRVKCARPPAKAPLIWLENVSRAFVHGCDVGAGGGNWVQQEQSREITLATNNVPIPRPPTGGK